MEWGMIVDISPPELETRAAILQAKAQEKNLILDHDIARLIATTQHNGRELEGILNKVIAYHELNHLVPTLSSVKEILLASETQVVKKSLTPREIIATITRYFDIPLEEILGKSREKKLSFPRQVAMFLLREELKMSFPSIGDELGGRDHTTAIHAHTKIGLEIDHDPKIKQDIESIKQRLYAEQVV